MRLSKSSDHVLEIREYNPHTLLFAAIMGCLTFILYSVSLPSLKGASFLDIVLELLSPSVCIWLLVAWRRTILELDRTSGQGTLTRIWLHHRTSTVFPLSSIIAVRLVSNNGTLFNLSLLGLYLARSDGDLITIWQMVAK